MTLSHLRIASILFLALVPSLALTPSLALGQERGASRELPPLRRTGKKLDLPLAPKAPHAWRAIGEGVKVKPGKTLGVAYTAKARAASGVVFPHRAGTLDAMSEFEMEITTSASITLVVSLRNAAGVAYSFPMASLSPSPKPQKLKWKRSQLTFDRFQNRTADPGKFDSKEAIAISFVDISSFMGPSGHDVRWKLHKVRAHFAKAGSKTDADKKDEGRSAGADRRRGDPAASAADRFYQIFNGAPERREEARALLTQAYAIDPTDAEVTLLLGMCHLWIAAEGSRVDPDTIEHVILADEFLDRFAALDPTEDRLPSWKVPVAIARARLEKRDADFTAIVTPLEKAYEDDPCFHSFSLALMTYPGKPGTKEFNRGLEALRQGVACSEEGDPSVQNQPHWPHNREGYVLFLADYEWRAGNDARARALLDVIRTIEEFETWPFKSEVEARETAWRDAESSRGGGEWMAGKSCQICHAK